jgi:hypothetical protein
MVARLAGGIVFEIPRYYANIKNADSCHVVFYNAGKMFSLVFDYYLS